MAGISTELGALAIGMAMAVVLLMLGASMGYWAGARMVVLAGPPTNPAWPEERAQLLSQLASWTEHSERASQESEALVALCRTLTDPLPVELTRAISCLVDTTAGLATQLRNARDPKFPQQQDKPQHRQPPRAYSVVTEREPVKIAEAAPASAASLTPEQMSDVIGGRKNFAESTLDLEVKRYPYDCFQQLAPWNDGDPAPTLEQFDKVRCHDISVSGISFFWPQVPDFESVAISIGAGEKLIFMHAQVCDHKAVYMHDEVSFLVGCRYLRRMDELTTQWHTADELVGVA